MNYIYALICPIRKVVRYVGKTNNPRLRLKHHINTAIPGASKQHKVRWIAKLLRAGLVPELKILAEVSDGDSWQDAERGFIAEYLKRGAPLTNGTRGGEGIDFLDPRMLENRNRAVAVAVKKAWADPEKRRRFIDGLRNPEVLKRRSEVSKRINADPVMRARLSAALKVIWRTPEGAEKASQRAIAMLANPEQNGRRLASIRAAYQKPEVKARLAKAMQAVNDRPEVKAKRSKSTKARWKDPACRAKIHNESTRQKMSAVAKARHVKPGYRDEFIKAMNDPSRTAKIAAAMAKRNADPAFRAKVQDPEVRARAAATLKETWRRRKLAAQQLKAA